MFPRLDQARPLWRQRRQQRHVRARESRLKELAAAESFRGHLWHQFSDFFTRYDGLLTPCMAVPPFPVEQNYPDSIARQADEDLYRLDRARHSC